MSFVDIAWKSGARVDNKELLSIISDKIMNLDRPVVLVRANSQRNVDEIFIWENKIQLLTFLRVYKLWKQIF